MISDERIIGRVLKGHTQDYRELVSRYQTAAFRLACRVLGRREDAEDAVQDAFLRAYSKLDTCRERSRFWPWLRRILLNTCLSRLRAQEPCDYVEDFEYSGPAQSPVEAEMLRHAEMEEIRKVIAGLPAPFRTVIVLRFQEELSYAEIAEVLCEPLSTIQVRMHRARKMLAERLEVISNEVR